MQAYLKWHLHPKRNYSLYIKRRQLTLVASFFLKIKNEFIAFEESKRLHRCYIHFLLLRQL